MSPAMHMQVGICIIYIYKQNAIMNIAGMCCICALITWLRKIAYTVSVRNNKFVIFLNVWDKKHAGCQKQNESFVKASNRRFLQC